jgi:spore germination cell wall hydrolase CwlJ-like protein
MLTSSNAYATVLTALCCWREARGEPSEAWQAVIWTILNRAAKPGWWGQDVVSVILCPEQFSSFDQGDPNATKFPSSTDPVFPEILILAANPGTDPTDGATNYFSGDVVPDWAATMTPTVSLGALHFYRQ